MIEINWHVFSEKFKDSAAYKFEFLAYCLFSYEFNIQNGLFRYKNHPGIETAPIENNGEMVGFQAKFYSNNISDNKSDIIDSIKKAQEAYPQLKKILIYVHQDLTYNTQCVSAKPGYLTEIETVASSSGLSIEWRTRSHIELMLSKPENRYLAEYFFCLDGGVFAFTKALSERTKNIFSSIRSSIKFSSKEIKFSRQIVYEELKKCKGGNASILFGIGGVGKTAAVKDFYYDQLDQYPVFILKTPEILDFFSPEKMAAGWSISIQDFLHIHTAFATKVFIVDSAEKMVDLNNIEPIQYFIAELLKNDWSIVFTTRTLYLEDLTYFVHENFHVPIEKIELSPIQEFELDKIAQTNKFRLSTNFRVNELLRIPFYLNAYLQAYSSQMETISDVYELKNTLLTRQVNGGNYKSNAVATFCSLVKQKNIDASYYIFPDSPNIHNDDFSQLLENEIIGLDKENNAFYIVHDVYEEWALTKIIQMEFSKGDYGNFFERIGNSLPIRRAYRIWMSEKLHSKSDSLSTFISYVMEMPDNYWKNETIIAVMLSPYASVFFEIYSSSFLEDNHQLLLKIANLLLIGCRSYNEKIKLAEYIDFKYFFTKPCGNGWESFIAFVYLHKESFKYEDISPFLPILKEWSDYQPTGSTTKYAALFALYFYPQYQTLKYRYTQKDNQHLLLTIITAGAAEIKTELTEIINDYLQQGNISSEDTYFDLCMKILTHPLQHIHFVENLPEQTIKIASYFWVDSQNKDRGFNSLYRIESAFSLSNHFSHEYIPASAYQTPIYWLLRQDFNKTLAFIIQFTNKVVESFAKDMPEKVETIKLKVTPDEHVEQYICSGLWNMHRGIGSPSMPDLLKSMHMGLERFLLEWYCDDIADKIEKILISIIKASKSASLSAVVTSVILKYPDHLFGVAKILFSSRTVIAYDYTRSIYEYQCKSLYSIGVGLNSSKQIYERERLETCNDTFRQGSLEYLMLYYQLSGNKIGPIELESRRKFIENILDSYYDRYDQLNDYEKFSLVRVDARKLHFEQQQLSDGRTAYRLVPDLPDELIKKKTQTEAELEKTYCYIGVGLWAKSKISGETIPETAQKYETSPSLALSEFHTILKQDSDEDIFKESAVIYTASVLVIYYRDILTDDEFVTCEKIIIASASKFTDTQFIVQVLDGSDAALAALPHLYAESKEKNNIIFILLLALFNDSHQGMRARFCDYAFKAIRNYAIVDSKFTKRLFGLYLCTHHLYEAFLEKFRQDRNNGIDNFWQAFIKSVEKTLMEKIASPIINTIDIASCSDKTICNAILLINDQVKDPDYFNFIKQTVQRAFFYLYHKEEKHSYNVKEPDFLEQSSFEKNLAKIILSLEPFQIRNLIESFNLTPIAFSRSSFLDTLISIEDQRGEYNNFWTFWNGIYPVVRDVIINDYGTDFRDKSQMLRSFLLAFPYWKKDERSWKSLKEREKLFYSKVIKELGYLPDVFYSAAKFLTEIGTSFQLDGLFWLRDIIRKQPTISDKNMLQEIQYYLELYSHRVIAAHRDYIRKNKEYKIALLEILRFLVELNSVAGYLMRESIL